MARKTRVTYDEALQALQDAVAIKGEDYVYPDSAKVGSNRSCVYFNEGDGTPACIVGHALASWGYTLTDLNSAGAYLGDMNEAGATPSFFEALNIEITDARTGALLGLAQDAQDTGRAWGIAVSRAVTDAQRDDQ